ncbi:MAG: hypothetical protein K2H19_08720 [Ruminococcus sp.]|nr:hypothetical protein [Ruminococcus sp.]
MTTFFITGLTSSPTLALNEQPEEMRDISTMESVKGMGIGINLGNTFDVC